jgi:DNA-binding NtrC family response regulator
MLVRAVLLLDEPELRRRVRDILSRQDVVVSAPRLRGEVWEKTLRDGNDLILVSHGRIPEPVAKTVARMRELPDRPEVIVFREDEDVRARAELLAAGCLAVLNEELSEGLLRDSLETLVERRKEWVLARMSAGRAQETIRLEDFTSPSGAMRTFLEMARRVVSTDS